MCVGGVRGWWGLVAASVWCVAAQVPEGGVGVALPGGRG